MKEYAVRKMGRPALWLAAWLVLLLAVACPLPVAEARAQAGPITSGVASPAYAASTQCSGDGVYLYEHSNYKGRCRKWTGDDRSLADDNLNDAASSIRFVGTFGGGRYTATLYEQGSFRGAWTTFGADDPDFANDAIGHDRASSIRVSAVPQCTGDGIYLYEHKNYAGRCRKFTASDDNLADTGLNDAASSIKFAGSYGGGRYKVKLCENPGFQGRCSVFTVDDKGFADENIGQDRTSSVEVTPVKAKFCVPTSGAIVTRYASSDRLDIAGSQTPGAIPVYAAHAGTVVYVGPADSMCSGRYAVAIRYDGTINGKHILTLYNRLGHGNGHNFASYVEVKLGDRVTRGQLIGYQGDAPAGMCGSSSSTAPGVQLDLAIYEKDKPFLEEYTSWGKRCEHSDLFFETGGTTASCSLKHTAEAVNPEAPRFLGPLGSTVIETCSK